MPGIYDHPSFEHLVRWLLCNTIEEMGMSGIVEEIGQRFRDAVEAEWRAREAVWGCQERPETGNREIVKWLVDQAITHLHLIEPRPKDKAGMKAHLDRQVEFAWKQWCGQTNDEIDPDKQ